MNSLLAKITTTTTMGAAIGLALITVEPAQAMNLKSYTVQWSGAQFGNGATATGTIVLDLDLINNPGFTGGTSVGVGAGTPFDSIEIEVMGALDPNANGLFTTSDFSHIFLRFTSPVDLTTELVGQAGFSGIPADFNIFRDNSVNPSAPSGNFFQRLSTSNGENMQVTSFAPTVPTPAAILPSLLGLGSAAFRKGKNEAESPESL